MAPVMERTKTKQRTKTSVLLDVGDQIRVHPAIATSLSAALLLLSGYLAFGVGIESIPQAMFFAATCSIGLGGLSTLLGGTATITIGKWFRATGYIAVFMAILMLVMQAVGILHIPTKTKVTALKPTTVTLLWAGSFESS